MKTEQNVPTFRMIAVKYYAATNTKPARIKIFEKERFLDDTKEAVMLSYDYNFRSANKQALNLLIKAGFKVMCEASDLEHHYFFCDNWGKECIKLSDLNK